MTFHECESGIRFALGQQAQRPKQIVVVRVQGGGARLECRLPRLAHGAGEQARGVAAGAERAAAADHAPHGGKILAVLEPEAAFGSERFLHAARVAGVSPLHFCKIFRQHTGLRFTEYVQRVRVRRARTLLAEEKRKIAEIAMACGFGSVSQFNRVFRRHTRETPRAFQEAERGGGKK